MNFSQIIIPYNSLNWRFCENPKKNYFGEFVMMAASLDENVQSISLHKSLPIVVHGYILPFMILYATWFYGWVFVYGVDDYYEPGLIVLAFIGVAQILVCLSCYWSVHIRAVLATLKVCYLCSVHQKLSLMIQGCYAMYILCV